MTQWYGLLAPKKWSKPSIDKLELEAIKAARGSAVKDKLSQETALAVGNTGKEFDAFIKAEKVRWKAVIERAQIKPDGLSCSFACKDVTGVLRGACCCQLVKFTAQPLGNRKSGFGLKSVASGDVSFSICNQQTTTWQDSISFQSSLPWFARS